MSSYWERLYQKRRSKNQCIACGSDDHWQNYCIYKYACYVCHGSGHKSFDCPTARKQLREEAAASAPTHYSVSQFLQQTNTQANAYTTVPKQQSTLVDYDPDFRFDRDYSSYSWGQAPDTFREPLYVRGLPTFELLPIFNRLLPSDFATLQTINKARRDAFKIMTDGIRKLLQEFNCLKDVVVQQQQIPIDEDENNGKINMVTKTFIVNPLAIAARQNNSKMAEALLHYATFAEETTQLIDIVAYNKKAINIKQQNGYGRYSIVVDGVGEGRPSVMRGDRVLLSPGPGHPAQGGIVHFVNADEIVFAMPNQYNYSQYPVMDLIFILPRTQERSYHRALSGHAPNWFLTNALCLSSTHDTYKAKQISGLHTKLIKKTISNDNNLIHQQKDDSWVVSPENNSKLEKEENMNIIDIDNSEASINISTTQDNQPSQDSQPSLTRQVNNVLPQQQQQQEQQSITTTTFYDFKIPYNIHHIALNEKQSEFVAHVLNLDNYASLCWGPPGTGKTGSLIYAMAEVLLRAPKAKILVVCPSNDAADLIVERFARYLDYINTVQGIQHKVLRVHSLSRASKGLSDTVIKYSEPSQSGGFNFPYKEDVLASSVVVSTIMTSDRLYGIGIENDFFTHLFVDEAGHATEQLLAIALSLASKCVKVVLAGDPRQLGPRIRADPLVKMKLQESPLKRLMEDEQVWSQCGTQLVENYRSHPGIIYIVNAFYNDTLIPASIAHGGRFDLIHNNNNNNNNNNNTANNNNDNNNQQHQHQQQKINITDINLLNQLIVKYEKDNPQNKYLKWTHFPSKDFPILCIDHNHPDSKEKDSPSWFNAKEVEHVLTTVRSLVFEQKICQPEDIAVITPYVKQVQKIYDALYWEFVKCRVIADQRPRLPIPIKIATVDSFQGREADVVILSCVRSNLQNAAHDLRFHMGFLTQPERSNVAISRARNALIIIGNLSLLQFDTTFAQYIQRMKELKVIVNHRDSNIATKDREDFVRAIKDMITDSTKRGDAENIEDDEYAGQGAHERSWTRHQ